MQYTIYTKSKNFKMVIIRREVNLDEAADLQCEGITTQTTQLSTTATTITTGFGESTTGSICKFSQQNLVQIF